MQPQLQANSGGLKHMACKMLQVKERAMQDHGHIIGGHQHPGSYFNFPAGGERRYPRPGEAITSIFGIGR